jgi:hypothetical protein
MVKLQDLRVGMKVVVMPEELLAEIDSFVQYPDGVRVGIMFDPTQGICTCGCEQCCEYGPGWFVTPDRLVPA